ncbi:unnamed protein product [Lactuca saligna]|uniref:MHD domain-containing protein n=1 Tax=Lactuca saligna TaxID=75948 RepID=A0AA35Z4X2_LACSI|nr:unnamed protein product [Lactuca saligna]
MARVSSNPVGLHKFRPSCIYPAIKSLCFINPSVHSCNRKLRFQRLYCQTKPNPTDSKSEKNSVVESGSDKEEKIPEVTSSPSGGGLPTLPNKSLNRRVAIASILGAVGLFVSGGVLRCDVTGKILMKFFLSGMPDLKLGLNDKISLKKEFEIKSHPTKRYRITEGVNLPFRVLTIIKELGRTRMEVNVKVKSVFGAKMFVLGVVIKIPVPEQTTKMSIQVTSRREKYNASMNCLMWKIRKFLGQTESILSAESRVDFNNCRKEVVD